MTKSELIQAVSDKTHTYNITANLINTTLEIIRDELVKGGSVNLLGFGKFSVRHSSEHQVIHPRTGEKIQIPASKHVHFTAGKSLKEAVR